ncbi:SAF domain-containing protein [Actinophytocola oryzae]|uniref:SAF domain-containing protein n=1 Tax=Actinophytocola oryzae TaxID=502181 RepID=UPI00106454A6|nr:SAF domain-containing protein [Actinophytocola oryzae]
MPHLVLGVLLVTASIAGAVLWSITTGERSLVLALTRSVTVGQPIASADLREVSVALDGAVDAIPATDAASVVGQLAAASLPAGVLLPRAALGTSMIPKPGDAIAALALEPGQVPPEVTQGTHVVVVLSADPNTESGSSDDVALESGWPAVVTGVSRPATERALVVSVLLAEDDARRVAASPVGRLSLVLVAEGGR